MANIDLKDAYFCLPIHSTSCKFLRFYFSNKLYEFQVLPFGLSSAPYVFTKLMKPIVTYLRKQGFSSVNYLDDFLCIENSFEKCEQNVKATCKLLESLGFIINYNKSKLIPEKNCKFLGFILDSENYVLGIPEVKRNDLYKKLKTFCKAKTCTIRCFASLIGSLIAVCPAIPYGMLYTKRLERLKFLALQANKGNYDSKLVLGSDIIEDFTWWENHIHISTNPIREAKYKKEIFTDASLTGWGVVCNNEKLHGYWNNKDKKHHINYLELKAIYFALQCLCKDLRDCQILLRCDNTTAISYINRMGGIQYPHLNNLARKIWQFCENKNIFIFASYIPSTENYLADRESRKINESTEWELHGHAYKEIIARLGSPCIDLFASRINTKCKLFVSWHMEPNCWAVDAFTISWKNLYFYAFPPFSLILKCLRKIEDDNAIGIIVELSSTSPEPYISCSHCIKNMYLKKGYSEKSISIIISSLSKNTLKQYDSSLRQWWNFCQNNIKDPYKKDIPSILSFLTEKFESGSAYSTINSVRSALSLLFNCDLGNHKDIKRFFDGLYKIRPNKPKYEETWDPAQVLEYLANFYPNINLSLEVLTKKLVMLLMLVTAQRLQTMVLIKIENIKIESSGVKIRIPDLIKTSRKNKFQPLLHIPFFTDNVCICPAQTLIDYLQRTIELRLSVQNLFINFKKPHNSASTHTLARWIKDILSKSGIDTSLFTAHSTRHASTSLANRSGINIDHIRKTAGWTNRSSTFAKFYNKPIIDQNNFSTCILASISK
ncbi:unnamed protein product [Parnassius mnemosyne]|uniref:Reverse transcriptase domain-containing protein n=1 Tax=Parnassius mnemosyne TaxID=213953 RepID=A0AAV1M8E1_9NEOP